MSEKNSQKFNSRVIDINGYCIYVGPCKKCPKSVKPWIKQFCKLPENNWFAEIDRSWAADQFNNYGLQDLIPNYELALNLISDQHSKDWIQLSDQDVSSILVQAKTLYGLLHARWICQTRGLYQMKMKYNSGIFGICPRACCKNVPLIPMGTTFKLRRHSVKMFCPCCYDIYSPPHFASNIDGAYFGPSFPHIFLLENQEFDLHHQFQALPLSIYGFNIHDSVRQRFEPHKNNCQKDEYPESN